jgi:hypothetical protein
MTKIARDAQKPFQISIENSTDKEKTSEQRKTPCFIPLEECSIGNLTIGKAEKF